MDIKLIKSHLSPVWGFLADEMVERAEGIYLYTKDGRRLTDFTSGHAVTNIGHNHPAVVQAIKEQADKIVHSGSTFYYDSLGDLVERLSGITPPGMDRFFFANSGAEAVEGAIKLARYVTGRQAIISFTDSFHGRTLATVSLGASSEKYRSRYQPLLPSVYHAPYPYCYRPLVGRPDDCEPECIKYMENMFAQEVSPGDVAAIIIEPVLGEGGYVPSPASFLERLRAICDEHGILLIFDEVQSGFGRTSRWFALDHYGVVPDIITAAKGIASGMPLSAVISRPDLMDAWPRGAHGTTFGGNPVSCAAAVATVDAIRKEGLLKKSERISRGVFGRLSALMQKSPYVGDVRGLGYMIGVEFVKGGREPYPEAVERVKARALERGLLLFEAGTHKNVIRLAPPLITTEEQMGEALDIFEYSVSMI